MTTSELEHQYLLDSFEEIYEFPIDEAEFFEQELKVACTRYNRDFRALSPGDVYFIYLGILYKFRITSFSGPDKDECKCIHISFIFNEVISF